MTFRDMYFIFATAIFALLIGLTIRNDKNLEKYENDLTEAVAERFDVNKERVDLVSVDEKKLYKAAINDKGYEIYINKEGNLSNIVEVSNKGR